MKPQTYLLDTSLLIDLDAEEVSGGDGPAHRALKTFPQGAIYLSPVTVAEFLEGAVDEEAAYKVLLQYSWHTIGDAVARRYSLNQRRAARKGTMMGENDAWQAAIASVHGHTLVGCDEAFKNRPWLKYIDHRKKFSK